MVTIETKFIDLNKSLIFVFANDIEIRRETREEVSETTKKLIQTREKM